MHRACTNITIIYVTKKGHCVTPYLLNCVTKTSEDATLYYNPSMARSPNVFTVVKTLHTSI
jgi:hypothetical protein